MVWGELVFVSVSALGAIVYTLMMLWLTFTHHDNQKTLPQP